MPIASFISPGDDNKSQIFAPRNYADLSELERERIKHKPEIPAILEQNNFKVLNICESISTNAFFITGTFFPLRTSITIIEIKGVPPGTHSSGEFFKSFKVLI